MIKQKENTIKQGELYLYDYGKNAGSVQNGERPVYVIQSNNSNYSPTVIVAAVTSSMKKQYLYTHIPIGKESGLKQNSMILLEQIKTVNRNELTKLVGAVIDPLKQYCISKAIKKLFGFSERVNEKQGDIRCLCSKCAEPYKLSNSGFVLRRLDPFANKKETCDKCNNLGYDYILYERRKT